MLYTSIQWTHDKHKNQILIPRRMKYLQNNVKVVQNHLQKPHVYGCVHVCPTQCAKQRNVHRYAHVYRSTCKKNTVKVVLVRPSMQEYLQKTVKVVLVRPKENPKWRPKHRTRSSAKIFKMAPPPCGYGMQEIGNPKWRPKNQNWYTLQISKMATPPCGSGSQGNGGHAMWRQHGINKTNEHTTDSHHKSGRPISIMLAIKAKGRT